MIRITFIESIREMVIVWSTMDDTSESIVEYFLDDQKYQAKGQSKLFVDDGDKKHQQYIHTVCNSKSFHDLHFLLDLMCVI